MLTLLCKYFSPFVSEHEIDLLQSFKPLYILVSGLGLFPRSIKFPYGKNNPIVLHQPPIINLACTFLIPVVICVFYAFHMIELGATVNRKNTNTTEYELIQTNYNIQLSSQLVVSTIIFICAFKYQILYIKILNKIFGSWTDLSDVTSGSNTILGRLRVQVNCVVIGSLFLALILQFTVTCTKSVSAWKTLLLFLSFALPELVQFTCIAFYFVMILMVIALLKNVEEHFRTIVCLKRIRSMGDDYVRVRSGPLPTSLCLLRAVYARAQGAKRQINTAFQAPLLLILAQSFHTLVSNAHALYNELIFRNSFNNHDLLESCCWCFYQIMKFYVIGKSGALLKLQVNLSIEVSFFSIFFINAIISVSLQKNRIGRALYEISTNCNGNIALHLEVSN